MTREVMQDLLKELEYFDKSSHLHGCAWQRSHIAKIKAVLAQPVQPAFPSNDEAAIEQLIEERDVREDVLDKVLDMVLGVDRPEWSSAYQYIDAVEDVREALEQPVPITDSTPKLKVGDSSFESWYEMQEGPWEGDKKLARDAYAAGMSDPLVTYEQPVHPVELPGESAKQRGLGLLAKAKEDAMDRSALTAFNKHFFKCTPSCTVKDWTTAWKKAILFWTGPAQPAQPVQPQRPINCGTNFCSCIECLFDPPIGKSVKPADATLTNEDTIAQPADKDAEIARLTACLKTANASAEKFEREWYLRGGEIEAMKALPVPPQGYKLVPLVPTLEMLHAVAKFDYESNKDVSWWEGYNVMLAAAPELPIANPVEPVQPAPCQHRFMYFGDQQKRRRCADCNTLEPMQPAAVSGLACNHEWVRREQDQPWLECEKCGSDYASSATIEQPVPPADHSGKTTVTEVELDDFRCAARRYGSHKALELLLASKAQPVERQPLTEDEMDLICEKALFCRISFQQFARTIEAAHDIKAVA